MDYRFAIRCWQDQAGDENAKANVFVDGVQVATEVEITATSADSPSTITWESTDLTAPAADTSFDIKVVMTNDYYVDASTDRNIYINGIGYINKDTDGDYKKIYSDSLEGADGVKIPSVITDFSGYDIHNMDIIPTAVTGDSIADDWWSGRGNTDFEIITVWGGDDGTTMTVPATSTSYS